MTIDLEPSVFVAGHRGLVGSAICRRLAKAGVTKVLTVPRRELDLRDQSAVNRWFEENRPDQVYLVAGTVGGIMANSTRQAEFLYDNLMIHATVVEAARRTGVSKLLYLGSACVYPRLSPQPIPESALLTGPLEPTNEGYSLAKIAGMRLCEFYREQYGCNFITAMPTNLYGPGDNFDLASSHVLPALMRKFHEAKVKGVGGVEIWGTGSAKREFLHVDDLADACLFLMDNYEGAGHINIGTGVDLSIGDLATMIRQVVYPEADMFFDSTKPDGMPRRVLDVTALTDLGWRAGISLEDGLRSTYAWFLSAMENPEAAGRAGETLGLSGADVR
ncbi:MAG: GDP-L-fucose synthase [Actinomycetota bacterium]